MSYGPAEYHAARLLQAVKYVNVASLTILILYILSRFPPFLDVPLVVYYAVAPSIPIERCHPIYSVASWFTIVGIVVAEAILMKRTVALWGVDKRVSIGLLILMVVIAIPCAIMLALFLRTLKYGAPPLPTVAGCYPTEGSVILFVDFILLILYESIMLGMTMWVGVKRFRHSRNPLITTLYRDGIFYFFYTFVISLGNILVLVAGPPELLDLLNTFQRVMHCILSTRVILHVRSADQQVKKDNLGGTGVPGETDHPLSAISFASRTGVPQHNSQSTSFTTTMAGLETRVDVEPASPTGHIRLSSFGG